MIREGIKKTGRVEGKKKGDVMRVRKNWEERKLKRKQIEGRSVGC